MSDRLPTYPSAPHKRGQARISLRGKDVYLGKFGSPESYRKFAQILGELQAGGIAKAPKDDEPVTCAELINHFRQWAEKRYVKNGKQTSEVYLYGLALAPVIEIYGDTPVNTPDDPHGEFGPLALIACRDWLRDTAGYCRKKINSHLGRIRRVWKWGVSRQIVRESSYNALKCVEGFRVGEMEDLPDVLPVHIDLVNALEKHVLPPIWAMIQLQLHTGMRPGEVCQVRTCDVLREDTAIPALVRKLCWTYTPESHKTEHHGRDRIILLGPKAQQIIDPWLRPNEPTKYLFSPAEAMHYARALRVAGATTHRKYHRVQESKRPLGERYTTHSYEGAIQRGCERAFGMPREWKPDQRSDAYKRLSAAQREEIKANAREWRGKHCWNPNQLRHTAATEIRKEHSLEVARIILGHSAVSTTEIYAEADLEAAAKAMADFG